MVTQTISYPNHKTPPKPPGYPLVGCLPKMLQNPLQFLMKSTLEYGDVVHLGAMNRQQVYLVSHPDHVKYILQENSQNYAKVKSQIFKELKSIFGENLAVIDGERWRRQRRLMQPAFHRQRIETLVATMTTAIGQMIQEWKSIEQGTPLDISVEIRKLNQKTALKTLFGVDADSKLTELVRAWDPIYKFVSDRLLAPVKLPVEIPIPSHRRFQEAMLKLNTFICNAIQERKQGDKNSGDLLSMLLNARDEESGDGMSDWELRNEIVAMFIGGFESSATVLAWTWYLLSKHPSVERKLNAELAEVLGERTPTFEDIRHLKYTRMVVEETMRLYPSVWLSTRTSLETDFIGSYKIPAESSILLSPFVTHRLPSFWKNPEGFDPERFAPEKVSARPRYAYYPFGGGSRYCIGDSYAMTQMQLVIAMVAQKFRLNLVPEHPVERQAGLTLRSRYGMLMTLEPKSCS